MESTNTRGGTTLVKTTAEGAAKKAGEKAADRALNAIIDFVKNKYGETQVKIGGVFNRYLENAVRRYNQIRTLATGTTPRSITGDDSLYVHIGLNYNGVEIDTSSIDPLLEISKNLLILGTGGVGKSMLTRYLFLDTAEYEGYVPVLIELRRIGAQSSGNLSILDLIYTCMEDFDVELPKDQFEYSLQLGKYLFLFDGFDEVKSSLAKETADAIQKFSAKYPQNAFIVTSRPRTETSPLETYTVVESMAMSKKQAIELASKIWAEDEKTREFCQQLDETLYEKHKDFTENPLLLTMMFLTFMRNSSIPDHLSDFYKKAYDALYSAHDNQDKGCYRRDFECKTLDENDFKKIFSHFCFQSYFKEDYEFSETKIISYLQNSLQKFGFEGVQAADYLKDLRNVVCMIIKDGGTYRFSHRSFQAYFAACYTTHSLTDEQQRKLFAKILSGRETFWEKGDYYTLLSQIEPERFAENALEEKLREIHQLAKRVQYPDEFYMKTMCCGVVLDVSCINGRHNVDYFGGLIIDLKNGNCYGFNIVSLFERYINVNSQTHAVARTIDTRKALADYVNSALVLKLGDIFKQQAEDRHDFNYVELFFDIIDESDRFTDSERQHFYNLLIKIQWGNSIHARVTEWLEELDTKRLSLESASFIDDL